MTEKIAWVTDTAALLDQATIEKYNVHVLPLHIVFTDMDIRETIDITSEKFYEKLQQTKEHPKTSQPPIGEVIALYERLKEEGYTCAIAVHTSKHLSGTYQTAFAAAEQAGFTVYPIDSKIGSFPMQKMIETGYALAEQGVAPQQIAASLTDMAERTRLSFIPTSLSQLHKSGRVSGTQLFLSNLLNIKLVISFEDGVATMKEKVRADKRARAYVVNQVGEDILHHGVTEVAIIHCNNEQGAEKWHEELKIAFPNVTFIVTELSICVGVHAGEGTLGLSWVQGI
ncbi:DegV family protein [Metalysinibacillus jejuensis]|uniref:DegV family protein n=1 Tax=Metalysinibacillus jejuensis TaxID=914327 RepID=UPI000D37286B|nr:DegV family protein [Metalysinibacillus jejuensis]